jgi:hypothetical protein
MAEAIEPDHGKVVPCWIWPSGAVAAYAAINILAWSPMEHRAVDAAAVSDGKPALSALVSTGFTFAVFWLVGLVAMSLCWRRRGFARLAVLTWPLAMLAIPEALRVMPTLWTWAACMIAGVWGAALLAGPETKNQYPASRA